MAPVTPDILEQMVSMIVAEVSPERIIVFGSWAKGTARSDSDVDFLIIESEPFGPNRSRRQEMSRLWRLLSRFAIPKDILVYSQDEVEQWQNSVNHIIATALREGKVLYEKH